MQEKHEQLGEHGAIPGVPNGPPQNGATGSAAAVGGLASAGLPGDSAPAKAPLLVQPQGTAPEPVAPITTLEVHELANLFPPMSDTEYAGLLASMREIGQTDPIVIYQGKVIDGRNRLRACRELGLVPKTVEWDGKGSLLEFVVSRNLIRRHLDESQRAMVAARLKPNFHAGAQIRMLAGKELDPVLNLTQGRSRDVAGALLNVSPISVTFACRVLEKGVPALIEAVERSRMAVSQAAVIAKLTAEQQVRLIAMEATEREKETKSLLAEQKHQSQAAQPGTSDADKHLLANFSCLAAKLSKQGKTFRLELTRNWQDELCKAVYQREHFVRLLRRGVLLVTEEDVK